MEKMLITSIFSFFHNVLYFMECRNTTTVWPSANECSLVQSTILLFLKEVMFPYKCNNLISGNSERNDQEE